MCQLIKQSHFVSFDRIFRLFGANQTQLQHLLPSKHLPMALSIYIHRNPRGINGKCLGLSLLSRFFKSTTEWSRTFLLNRSYQACTRQPLRYIISSTFFTCPLLFLTLTYSVHQMLTRLRSFYIFYIFLFACCCYSCRLASLRFLGRFISSFFILTV